MSTDKFKLTYFNLRGRGEPIRFILTYVGVEFEDVRIAIDEWLANPKMKETTPAGKMPVLEITFAGGKKEVLTESISICRYLARKYGLVGENDDDAAHADEIVDTLLDVALVIGQAYYEPDQTRKTALYNKVKTELFPVKVKLAENWLKENGGKHFIGNKYTWVDIIGAWVMKIYMEYGKPISADLSTDFPLLVALCNDFEALPQIAAYIAKRPVTDR